MTTTEDLLRYIDTVPIAFTPAGEVGDEWPPSTPHGKHRYDGRCAVCQFAAYPEARAQVIAAALSAAPGDEAERVRLQAHRSLIAEALSLPPNELIGATVAAAERFVMDPDLVRPVPAAPAEPERVMFDGPDVVECRACGDPAELASPDAGPSDVDFEEYDCGSCGYQFGSDDAKVCRRCLLAPHAHRGDAHWTALGIDREGEPLAAPAEPGATELAAEYRSPTSGLVRLPPDEAAPWLLAELVATGHEYLTANADPDELRFALGMAAEMLAGREGFAPDAIAVYRRALSRQGIAPDRAALAAPPAPADEGREDEPTWDLDPARWPSEWDVLPERPPSGLKRVGEALATGGLSEVMRDSRGRCGYGGTCTNLYPCPTHGVQP